MKKIMKRLLVLAMLILAPAFVTYAEDESGTNENTTGSITISGAIADKTYSAYKILDLESFDTGKGAYTYTVAEGWADFFDATKEEGVGASYVTIDDLGYVTWKESVDETEAKALAQAALTYAKAHTSTIEKINPTTQEGTTVKFTGLDLGYYLVDSSVGALCSLTTTNRNATADEKNSEPTVDKKIVENETLVGTNDVKIGDTINYQATITVGKGAQSYVLFDKMSTGLTFSGSITAYLKENGTETEVLIDASNYTFDKIATADYTFKVSFSNDYTKNLVVGDQIIVKYSAVLNKEAVVAGSGNTNEVWLTYGDDNTANSEPTITYTYSFDLVKTTDTHVVLNGATFKLCTSVTEKGECQGVITLISNGTDAKGFNLYRVAESTEVNSENAVEIIDAGKAKISGLDSTTYYLVEITPPEGYNKLAGPVNVVINGKNITATLKTVNNEEVFDTDVEGNGIQVINKTGSLLPSTGGIGTILFVVIGSVMMIGCGVLLVAKLRISKMSA